MSTLDEQVNKQYCPRFWTKRLPENVVVEHHIKFVNSVSENIKSEIPFIHDIRYGKKATNLMDLYGVDLHQGAPIFVYIHGGYWEMLSKNESNYVVKPLWKAKIKACIPDYDLAPKVTLEEIVEDVRAMAKHVLQIGVDNNVRSIWFGGHCSGAHLAASLLDESWLSELPLEYRIIFKGLILISGIYDLQPLLKTEFNNKLKLDSSRAVSLSPMYNAKDLAQKSLLSEDFKVVAVVAQYDSPAFKEQSTMYFEKLKKVNINVQYHQVPEVDHFDIIERLHDETYVLSQQIISLIKDF
uniref:Putative kynurenine formamidase n=1 Tax=Panstrongylus lignarius TaxID=156445 RepID=A0A224XKW5_9HEMI